MNHKRSFIAYSCIAPHKGIVSVYIEIHFCPIGHANGVFCKDSAAEIIGFCIDKGTISRQIGQYSGSLPARLNFAQDFHRSFSVFINGYVGSFPLRTGSGTNACPHTRSGNRYIAPYVGININITAHSCNSTLNIYFFGCQVHIESIATCPRAGQNCTILPFQSNSVCFNCNTIPYRIKHGHHGVAYGRTTKEITPIIFGRNLDRTAFSSQYNNTSAIIHHAISTCGANL